MHLLTEQVQVIKDAMDKKFGPPWHIVAGKYFSYEVTYEVSTICCQPLSPPAPLLLSESHVCRAVQTPFVSVCGWHNRGTTMENVAQQNWQVHTQLAQL